jgi:hypothetical protein
MRVVHFLLGLAMAASAAPAGAELFLDAYGGGAFTEDAALAFGSSGVVGARGGMWGEHDLFFVGGAVDVSTWSPDEGALEARIVPVSFLLMGRFPLLRSHDHPEGLLHPYTAAGPSIVVSAIDVSGPGPDFEDEEVDIGADVRGGVALLPVEAIALLLEYRFTYARPTWDDRVVAGGESTFSSDISTHFVQAGLSFRF